MASMSSDHKWAELFKTLEAGGYNAKPTKLRQGSVTLLIENPDGTLRGPTDEELDTWYDAHEAKDGK